MKHILEGIEYDTLLSAMKDQRIFSVVKDGDGFEITDECDGCFVERLTREQLLALAEELKALANS